MRRDYFDRVTRIPIYYLVHGLFFLLFGVFACITSFEAGSFFLIVGFVLFSCYDGAAVDMRKGRVMEFMSLFFIRFGSWVPLKEFDHIAISKIIYHNNVKSENVFRIELVPISRWKTRAIILKEYPLDCEEEIFEKLEAYSNELNLPIKRNVENTVKPKV